MSRPIYFISDLHLEASQKQTQTLFFEFLRYTQKTASALYILGDLFELWVGDRDVNSPFHQAIIKALMALTGTGIPVYCMHGNRDFLLGRKFMRVTGCRFLPDPCVIDLYGTATLLTHGDSLCTDDVAYQRFKKKVRNPFFKSLFLLRSLNSRHALAEKARQISRSHTRMQTASIMDVTAHAVTEIMQRYRVTQLIHGHTHRPAVHSIKEEANVHRYVLGAWHEGGYVLIGNEKRTQLYAFHSIEELKREQSH